VSKEFLDAKVIEAHIVPGQLLFTTLIPTQVQIRLPRGYSMIQRGPGFSSPTPSTLSRQKVVSLLSLPLFLCVDGAE
jgi:hypothetical protein